MKLKKLIKERNRNKNRILKDYKNKYWLNIIMEIQICSWNNWNLGILIQKVKKRVVNNKKN